MSKNKGDKVMDDKEEDAKKYVKEIGKAMETFRDITEEE